MSGRWQRNGQGASGDDGQGPSNFSNNRGGNYGNRSFVKKERCWATYTRDAEGKSSMTTIKGATEPRLFPYSLKVTVLYRLPPGSQQEKMMIRNLECDMDAKGLATTETLLRDMAQQPLKRLRELVGPLEKDSKQYPSLQELMNPGRETPTVEGDYNPFASASVGFQAATVTQTADMEAQTRVLELEKAIKEMEEKYGEKTKVSLASRELEQQKRIDTERRLRKEGARAGDLIHSTQLEEDMRDDRDRKRKRTDGTETYE